MGYISSIQSEYAANIFRLAENRDDKVFYNSSAEHAMIVHQALAKTANEYIYIFSSSMCSEISNNNEYLDYLKDFLNDKSHEIRIVFTDFSEAFLKMPIAKLLATYPLQVSIKKYPGKVLYNGYPAHFTVTDDRAFRLETDIENHMAFGNFNSPSQALALKEVFDRIYQSKLASEVTLC